mmetsp:Transcript_7962/g.19583  ORF Transcript_7962/g.19583 Transcript_7962/m.19583 type:complete len:359 (-) Transcript_7962:1203-2279(-)
MLQGFQTVFPEATLFRNVQEGNGSVADLLVEHAGDPGTILHDWTGRIGVAHDVMHISLNESLLHNLGVFALGSTEPLDANIRVGLGLEFLNLCVALVNGLDKYLHRSCHLVHGLVADSMVGQLVSLVQQPDHVGLVAIRQKRRDHHKGGLGVVFFQQIQNILQLGVRSIVEPTWCVIKRQSDVAYRRRCLGCGRRNRRHKTRFIIVVLAIDRKGKLLFGKEGVNIIVGVAFSFLCGTARSGFLDVQEGLFGCGNRGCKRVFHDERVLGHALFHLVGVLRHAQLHPAELFGHVGFRFAFRSSGGLFAKQRTSVSKAKLHLAGIEAQLFGLFGGSNNLRGFTFRFVLVGLQQRILCCRDL